MIRLNNICAGYKGTPVLKNVSLNINKGELTCIVGVNGCGKSTLLKAICGLLPVSSGSIYLEDKPLDTLSRQDIAKGIAYLPQEKSVADMTVEQAVLHGRFPHLSYPRRYTQRDYDIALLAMDSMGITHLAKRPLSTLSGGMRQNTYIAMALTQSTDYILLDEPATYLDITHQLELMKTLCTLSHNNKGIAAVMHDIPLALNFANRIIVLNNGNIAADNTPEEIIRSNIIKDIFGVEVEYSNTGEAYYYRY